MGGFEAKEVALRSHINLDMSGRTLVRASGDKALQKYGDGSYSVKTEELKVLWR